MLQTFPRNEDLLLTHQHPVLVVWLEGTERVRIVSSCPHLLCCLRARGLPTATLYTNQIKHTNDSGDTDIFTLMSMALKINMYFYCSSFLAFS